MKRIMQPYEVIVEIGNDVSYPMIDGIPINLTQEGIQEEIHFSGQEDNRILFPGPIWYFYEPQKIIRNLISALTQVAEANKQKINGLELALRSFKSLSDDLGNEKLSQSEVTV